MSRSVNSFHIGNPKLSGDYGPKSKLLKYRQDRADDETVYIAEPVLGNDPVGTPFAELYLTAKVWLKIQVALILDRNTNLECILLWQILKLNTGNVRDKSRSGSGMKRDEAVLVEIAKLMQLPQGMTLRRVDSIMRLERVDLPCDSGWETLENLKVVPSRFGVGDVIVNGEANVRWFVLSSNGCRKLPSHLVKTRTQTVKEFSEEHGYDRIVGLHFRAPNVSAFLNVILADDGIRFFQKEVDFPTKSVKMEICPLGLHCQIARAYEFQSTNPQQDCT